MAKLFKDYPQGQMMLLPPSLDELIDSNHPVRVVNEVINQIDLSALYRKYAGGGQASYHPQMLLKVLVYSYLSNVYSSRKMEDALKQNIHFMWLSAMQTPDHNTLNRFRGERLQELIKPIFANVVELLVDSGHVSLQQVYTDGTKIEANANRYSFVWGKGIKTNKAKMGKALEALWDYAESVAAEELKDQRPSSFDPIDKEHVQATIDQINSALQDKKVPAKVKKKLKNAEKNYPDKIEQYNQAERILEGRGSYSKTDIDATFMRMKEDHMQNSQLKAAYNLQFSTNEQYILHYSLHRTPSDTITLKSHLDQFKNLYNQLPVELCADAGYGSEENYLLLEQNQIEAYVKYNTFDKSRQKAKWEDKHPFDTERLHYNAELDCFYCPMGQKMQFIGTIKQITATGFEQHLRRYQAQRCEGCPIRSRCHKSKRNRIIQVNFRLKGFRDQAKERLESERGVKHRKKRSWDVEPVFGQIKQDRNFRRFLLRSKAKVEIEAGLLAIAHNLKKRAKYDPMSKAS